MAMTIEDMQKVYTPIATAEGAISSVPLTAEGVDDSDVQHAANEKIKQLVEARLKPSFDIVDKAVDFIRTAGPLEESKENLGKIMDRATSALEEIRKVDTDVFKEYLQRISKAIADNKNIEPWFEEFVNYKDLLDLKKKGE